MTIEVWKSAPGYEGIYEVSTLGSVRSLTRRASESGQARNGRILKPMANLRGYMVVGLWKAGTRTPYLVHRLVLLTFIGACPEGQQGCHGDGNPGNNRLDNLRWDSLAANQADRRGHGTAFTRANHPCAKLRPEDVDRAAAMREAGGTHAKIAAVLGVSRRAIGIALQTRG